MQNALNSLVKSSSFYLTRIAVKLSIKLLHNNHWIYTIACGNFQHHFGSNYMPRYLGPLERMVTYSALVHSENFVLTAKLHRALDTEQLLNIANPIVSNKPLLNCCVATDNQGLYFTKMHNSTIVMRAYHDTSLAEAVDVELNDKLDLYTGTLLRLATLQTGDRFYLLFVFHHLIAEGVAATQLCMEILDSLNQQTLSRTQAHDDLPSCVEEKLLAQTTQPGKIDIPPEIINQSTKQHAISRIDFNSDQVSQLKKSAKQQESSYNALISSMLITAYHNTLLTLPIIPRRVLCLLPVNVKPLLADNHTHSFGYDLSRIDLLINTEQCMMPTFTSWIDQQIRYHLINKKYLAFSKAVVNIVQQIERSNNLSILKNNNSIPSIWISNIGESAIDNTLIDNIHISFDVDSLYLNPHSIACTVATINNNLGINIHHPTGSTLSTHYLIDQFKAAAQRHIN